MPLRILSDDVLIPQKKPIISEKTLEKTKISNFLIPPKKPYQNEIQQPDQKKKAIKIVDGVILPKTKPLIVKKDKKIVAKKSKYYSEKDFSIAQQAIKLMEKRNWFEAERIAKKALSHCLENHTIKKRIQQLIKEL